ncbi:MAG: CDP-diacylglycerol--glycerol-3-phosphate 3-phosphatidyltransferase [Syntrophomonadaceae bacterium]|nr:CDP-diacylglycerol--glycerol-3-phosphate 3-phosphatidyltransferase [Syntrophomonadaceae bacterium]
MIWNLPNSLTFLRIILIPVLIVMLYMKGPYNTYAAAAIFIIAAVTDSLDGYLARRFNQVTKFGVIMDPVADKLLITATLICFVETHVIQAWIAILFLGREFAVSGLRTLKAEEGSIIAASVLGKSKTFSQIVAITFLILEPAYYQFFPYPLGTWMLYIALLISLFSAVDYFKKFLYDK